MPADSLTSSSKMRLISTSPPLRKARTLLSSVGFALFTLGSAPVFAATLHAVLIADTSDPDIGASAARDLGRVEQLVDLIAAQFDDTKIQILRDGDATPAMAESALNRVKTEYDDTVFLYYSGHGDKGPEGSPWPTLTFGDSSISASKLLSITRADVSLRTIAIFDACNGERELPSSRWPASISADPSAVQEMFRGFTGTIIATSSERPYVSYADSDGAGSFFTTELLTRLTHELGAPDRASWKRALEGASESMREVPQVPVYKLSPGIR